MTREAADRLLARAWADLGRDPSELAALAPLPDVPLPARLDVSSLAAASVAAASLAAWSTDAASGSISLDGARIATAFQSERVARLDGEVPSVWSPLSGFRRSRDGWVRTHGNYPHHAAALRGVLDVDEGADAAAIDAAVGGWSAVDLAEAVTRAGGMCVAVEVEDPDVDHELRRHPLVEVSSIGDAEAAARRSTDPDRPLAGIRILDLTRVIAGPVATRTLALLGADVLRIDPPSPAEPEWQHLEGGPGKRSALLDLRSDADAGRFDELLAEADAIVLGYRPAALDRLGLAPADLAVRRPGLVVGQLSAWGFDGVAGERGGFDSLVQAASGISLVEGTTDAPGALPAQALDHSTGYLLAAAMTSLIGRRSSVGGSWLARMSLRRTAAELLGLPRRADAGPSGMDDATRERHAVTLVGPAGEQRIAAPAVASPRGAVDWPDAPHRWGSDQPSWAR
ncbi:putative L-carnitine dehydratase [Agromyces luteolus]|uniref:Carnitine dehydratase n=1 Tax=Agromyces luteolus TaxID=88373 RepID=A0A7C9HI09_9MICO|nr:CoA transferase [Agromyces luteolus]MUN07487.1 carnitine dehydratase [Agromyces luteolus]GLK29380.1 putative L-carnitine dehydratase [Agromyces luteolus]